MPSRAGAYGSLTAAARTASRTGPPTVAGRWSLLPAAEPDTTVRAHALARTLLDRHGVVTRGAVAAEGVEGGFSAVYRVLSVFEESGQARRGYVVEGLGAAQFAMDGAVDRLRAVANARERTEGLPAPSGRGGFGPRTPLTASALRAPRTASPSRASRTRSTAQTAQTARPAATAPRTATPPPAVTTRPTAVWTTPAWTVTSPGHRRTTAPTAATPRPATSPTRSPPRLRRPPRRQPRPLRLVRPPMARPPTGPAAYGTTLHRGHGTGRAGAPAPDPRAVVLAAADPANAYGSALAWPEPPTGAGHKPGRKAGSLVVLVEGELTLYMERGGKTLLAWPAAPDTAPGDDPPPAHGGRGARRGGPGRLARHGHGRADQRHPGSDLPHRHAPGGSGVRRDAARPAAQSMTGTAAGLRPPHPARHPWHP
ncbi:hypothetical protein LT493_18060 [Streptomyces tricolor]|nr:hypothetical protein [Streptomyces tricolor]